jgi:hypothetical protein
MLYHRFAALVAVLTLSGARAQEITTAKQTAYNQYEITTTGACTLLLIGDGTGISYTGGGTTKTVTPADAIPVTAKCSGEGGYQMAIPTWQARYEQSTACCRDNLYKVADAGSEYQQHLPAVTFGTNQITVTAAQTGAQFTYAKIADGPVVLLWDPIEDGASLSSVTKAMPAGALDVTTCSLLSDQYEVCVHSVRESTSAAWVTTEVSDPAPPPSPPKPPPDPPSPPRPYVDIDELLGRDGGLGGGAIAGIVIALIIVLLILVVVYIKFCKKGGSGTDAKEVQVTARHAASSRLRAVSLPHPPRMPAAPPWASHPLPSRRSRPTAPRCEAG